MEGTKDEDEDDEEEDDDDEDEDDELTSGSVPALVTLSSFTIPPTSMLDEAVGFGLPTYIIYQYISKQHIFMMCLVVYTYG